MATYSFMDVHCAIHGPQGDFILNPAVGSRPVTMSPGTGAAEEGITVEMTEDKDTMTMGADGTLMHSLHAASGGRVTVRLLKTSPVNQLLANMYNAQTTSAATHGINNITITDTARNDTITCTSMAFMKFPNVVYAKEGGVMEWVFGGVISQIIGGGGTPNSIS